MVVFKWKNESCSDAGLQLMQNAATKVETAVAQLSDDEKRQVPVKLNDELYQSCVAVAVCHNSGQGSCFRGMECTQFEIAGQQRASVNIATREIVWSENTEVPVDGWVIARIAGKIKFRFPGTLVGNEMFRLAVDTKGEVIGLSVEKRKEERNGRKISVKELVIEGEEELSGPIVVTRKKRSSTDGDKMEDADSEVVVNPSGEDEDDEANKKKTEEPSFFKKYWWIILLGFGLSTLVNSFQQAAAGEGDEKKD